MLRCALLENLKMKLIKKIRTLIWHPEKRAIDHVPFPKSRAQREAEARERREASAACDDQLRAHENRRRELVAYRFGVVEGRECAFREVVRNRVQLAAPVVSHRGEVGLVLHTYRHDGRFDGEEMRRAA